MADVAITKSKSITIRGGQVPSSPVIPETPTDPVVLPSAPPHNNLNGLQGGQAGQYYHLNAAQQAAAAAANTPSGINPFATIADNYSSWNLRTQGVQRLAVTSGNFIDIVGGSNVTVGYASNVITISSIDTNTTYTAGAGLTLTGTTFSLTGQALALHNLASNGLIAITGAGSVASRTIIGSSSISVTNGNGVSGNPTLSAIFGTTVGTVAEGNDSRFHNPVTIGTANGLSLSTQVLSLGLASTSTNGALSSTDWNNFNTAFGWGNHASAGYTSNAGTVTSVTGGTGLSGTVTTSGSINAVIAGPGLTLMPSRGRQVNGADMNTWLDSGVYGINESVTNGPSVSTFDPVLVLRNIDVGVQLKIPRLVGNMEYRGWSADGSSWTSWITVWDSNNFNPSTKADTGGGNATGTWGINITGNSNTASTLQTSRTINGTSFNGSANITTANWGTARTLTIGSTGKLVDGSANVSWSLAEIGAQPAGSYALTSTSILAGNGLTGGGDLTANRTLSVVFGTTAGTVAEGNDSRILNGQTAFGWGNHAGLYQPLDNTIWRNRATIPSEGAGNSLFDDARLNTRVTENGTYQVSNIGSTSHLITSVTGGSTSVVQLGFNFDGDFRWRNRTDTTNWQSWRTVWHSGSLPNPIQGSGSAGQVSFWTGVGTQSGDGGLVWDNTNKRLGIGTTNPSEMLTVSNGSNPTAFSIANTSGIFRIGVSAIANQYGSVNAGDVGIQTLSNTALNFATNGDNVRMRITSGGNVLIGTTSELTGGGRLQVNGTVNCDDPTADRHAVTRGWANSNLAVLRTAGDATTGALRYAGTTRTAGQLYGGTANPVSTTRLNYDGDLVSSTFYSEEIILNLSSLNTDVTVKTFNTTDKFIFIVSAQPTGNISGSAVYSAHKGHDGTNSVFRFANISSLSNIALNADSTGSTLIARATGTPTVNAEIKVTILYLNRT